MKCSYCGHEMPDGAMFCAKCGNAIGTDTAPTPPQATVQEAQQPVAPVADAKPLPVNVNEQKTPPEQTATTMDGSIVIDDRPIAQQPPAYSAPTPTTPAQTPPQAPQYQQQMPPNVPPTPVPPYSGYVPPTQNVPVTTMVEDKKSIGLNILGFFIPLVGLILWAVNKDKKPIQSKSVAHSAIGGFVTSIVVSLIAVLITVVGSFALIGGIANSFPDAGDDVYYSETQDDYEDETEASDKKDEIATQKSSVPSVSTLKWDNIQVTIGKETVSLPCNYKTFVDKTGLKMNEEALTLKADNYTYVDFKDTNGNRVRVKVLNATGSTIFTNDNALTVVGVSVDADDYSGTFTAPCGFSLGDEWNLQAFSDKYGKPYYEYNSDSSQYASREWQDPDDIYNEIEIYTYEGAKIEEISVSCFSGIE